MTFSYSFPWENIHVLIKSRLKSLFMMTRSWWYVSVGVVMVLCWTDTRNTWRNLTVLMTSKRRHFYVITSKWRRFDVITTSLLRNVSVGDDQSLPKLIYLDEDHWRVNVMIGSDMFIRNAALRSCSNIKLETQSSLNLVVHKNRFCCQIFVITSTEQDRITAVLWAKFRTDWTVEKQVTRTWVTDKKSRDLSSVAAPRSQQPPCDMVSLEQNTVECRYNAVQYDKILN